MNFEFDEKGFLKPYTKIETSLEVFKEVFVSPFPLESSRHEIFVGYLHFLNDFREQITPNFTQWIGGSFVTQKESPKDIDFITLIDSNLYKQKEKLIDTQFRRLGAKNKYEVDAYTLWVFPENHPNFVLTKFDMFEWHNWWTSTPKNRFGTAFKKGFLEIKFSNHGDFRSL